MPLDLSTTGVSPMPKDDPARQAFLKALGEELRELRVTSEYSQAEMAEWFDWQRDALSKTETGKNNLTLYDYLKLMRHYAAVMPKHPALALANRFGVGLLDSDKKLLADKETT